jgi:Predicted integral membrane protein
MTEPPEKHPPARPRGNLLSQLDRRTLRSILYTAVTVLLFLAFKVTEWLLEHSIAQGKQWNVPIALAVALVLGIVFQLFHHRVEHATSHWLDREGRRRRSGIEELIQEIALIRDGERLRNRVVGRLDELLNTRASAIYLQASDWFVRSAGGADPDPARVAADDPAIIQVKLRRAPSQAVAGSALAFPMVWPLTVRGDVVGVLAGGRRVYHESLDPAEVATLTRLAEAVANALALIERPASHAAVLSAPDASPSLPDKPSIAVLPFESLGTTDAAPDYFADGAVEEIITALSRFQWLFVIARNSSFAYRGKSHDIKQVARELGVRYILQGSVRKSANAVRISGQLVDAHSGAQLWADRVEGQLEDVFALQDRVATSVVTAIVPKVEQAELRRALSKPTENMHAYDYYLRGISLIDKMTSSQSDACMDFLRKAIELDPEFAMAYAKAALAHTRRMLHGWIKDPAGESSEAAHFARRALEMGRDDAVVLCTCGYVMALSGHLDQGMELVNRGLALNPNYSEGWTMSAWMNLSQGEHEKVLEQTAIAIRLSPLDSQLFKSECLNACALFLMGRNEEAAMWATRALGDSPDYISSIAITAGINAVLGRHEEARTEIEKIMRLYPGLRLSNARQVLFPVQRLEEDVQRYIEALRLAGLPE